MYDDDVMLPADPEQEQRDAEAARLAEDRDDFEAIAEDVVNIGYDMLIKNGYSPEEASEYCTYPEVVAAARKETDADQLDQFAKEHPDFDPRSIHPDVWKGFQKTGNLERSLERNDPFLKGFMADMPKSKAKSRRREDPFVKGFDSI